MEARHPFSKSDIHGLIVIHTALVMGMIVFAAVVLGNCLRNRGIGPGIIPDFVTRAAYANAVLPVLALIASRLFLSKRFSRAFTRLRSRELHIEGFKSEVRTAYLVRAAITELPALIGLAAAFLVALGPGDIFAAPRVHLSHFLGALLFVVETLRVAPTEGRINTAFREYAPE
ncbi:MAG: hypothetical protein JWP91_2031 [Fibrobacteres bacterium]|nr:hypothetical protein [Fibrobacterota bacterium]